MKDFLSYASTPEDGASRPPLLRRAVAADVPGIPCVRMSVRENRLTTTVITEADTVAMLEVNGRGWVVECEDEVIAFAIGNATNGSLWALFVHPDHEARGHGRRLLERAVRWLHSRGWRRLWLTTEPHTRARGFYEAAGWRCIGPAPHGEVRLELELPSTLHA